VQSRYGFLDRVLHRIALGPRIVGQVSFNLERARVWRGLSEVEIATRVARDAANPVYITGLARSGTTILLRVLAATGYFHAQTYRDMPFVLAPSSWRKLAGRGSMVLTSSERPHGDGILVDMDSPEAFEEVFWKSWCRYRYDGGQLWAEAPSLEVMQQFAQFRAIVCSCAPVEDRRRRYLSKNNNNLLRLPQLLAEPGALMLVPYRNPLACAQSLHRQHLKFCTLQRQEPFVCEYMNLLVHREFGLDHLPLSIAMAGMPGELSPMEPDYWLQHWCGIHEWLMARPESGFRLLNHDRMVARPHEFMSALFKALAVGQGVEEAVGMIRAGAGPETSADGFAAPLVERAARIHAEVSADARNLVPVGCGP
jgi:hypothetical protein